MRLLVKGIIWLLRRCISEEAKETPAGKTGGIPKVFLIFPLFILGMMGGFELYLRMNPVDPDRVVERSDVIAGWGIVVFACAVLGWTLVYFLSFRVLVVDNVMTVGSLVTRRKQIRLDQPFGFLYDEEKDKFHALQGDQVIKLSWIVNGYTEFLNLVWMKSRRWS